MITINQNSSTKGLFVFALLLGIVALFFPFGDKNLDWQESATLLIGYYIGVLFLILMSLWILTTKLKVIIDDDGILSYVSNKKIYNKSYKMDSLLWWGVFYSSGGQSVQIKFPGKKILFHQGAFTNIDELVNYLANHYPDRME